MRVLLTGATGFIGSHILMALHEAGHDITVIKRSTSVVPAHIEIINNVSWYDNDENLYSKLKSLERFDVIVHLATNYGSKKGDWVGIENDNVGFPLFLLQFAMGNGCKLFINTDSFFSRRVYSYAHMEEYILTKQCFSMWGVLVTRKIPDFCFVNARLEHVYGPGDGAEKFTMWLLKNLITNKKEINLTACDQKRDFIYIDDVVGAYLSIMNNAASLKGYCEIGIGSGNSVPLKDFVLTAKNITGSGAKLLFGAVPQRQGEIMHSQADPLILNSFGWKPEIDLIEGINRTVKKSLFKS